MKRILIGSIVMLLGLSLVGGAGAYFVYRDYLQKSALLRFFAWSELAFATALNQFDHNTKEAEPSLLRSLKLYQEGLQSSIPDPMVSRAIRMRCGLIKARLSVLQKEAGNPDQAKSYMSEAQADLKGLGWTDVSEATVLQAVKRHTPH